MAENPNTIGMSENQKQFYGRLIKLRGLEQGAHSDVQRAVRLANVLGEKGIRLESVNDRFLNNLWGAEEASQATLGRTLTGKDIDTVSAQFKGSDADVSQDALQNYFKGTPEYAQVQLGNITKGQTDTPTKIGQPNESFQPAAQPGTPPPGSLGDIAQTEAGKVGTIATPPLPGAEELGKSFITQFGETQGKLTRDTIQAQLGALPTLRAETQKDIETFYPGFMESRIQLGDLAKQLSTALSSGTSYSPASREKLREDVRAAQGVRGLGNSPDAVVDESLALRAFDEQARSGVLGDILRIYGAPLPTTPTTIAAPQFGQVASVGLGAGNLAETQKQTEIGAFQAAQEPVYFEKGMEYAKANQPKQPGFFDYLGQGLGVGAMKIASAYL